jgi:putative PIN family toxin of toxin-antitoxin system
VAKTIRAVLDTNVFVSAALSKNPSSPTREALERWERMEFALLICTPLAEEIVEKLIDHSIDESLINALVESLTQLAEWVEISSEQIENLLSDPDDNIIVACAVEGGANYLVTYDPHFDALTGEYRGVKILKAIPFLEVLRQIND